MTLQNGNDPQLQEREKFVLAFNDTMLKIWREQMTLLGVIDTGRLLHSPKSLPVRADGRFIELGLSQSFIEYGLWQNFGTGKEFSRKREQSGACSNYAECSRKSCEAKIPRGNKGDIGRERKRKKKPWFSRKYYTSVMNLRDFLSDNIAHEFVGVVAQALISSITSLITSFRSETREEAITPEVLGALLQKIADLLGKAALQTDVSRLDNWRSDLARIGYVLTSLTIGSDDRNNVYFTLGKANLSTGINQIANNSILIRQATTERAGVMRAQQVQDLNKCKSELSSCIASVAKAQEALVNFQKATQSLSLRISKNNNEIGNNAESIQVLQSDLKSVASQIKSLQTDIQKFATMKQATQMHIECIITNSTLVIQDAYRYIRQGLTPVIFRHTVRTSRKQKDENGVREYLPRRRGWNRFYDDRKISVNNSDEISFRLDKEGDPNRGKFFTEPGVLFGDCRAVIDPNTQRLSEVRIYFGKRSFNILGINRHFRFAIGFYKKSKDYGPFQFGELRTNLAEFRVIARADRVDGSNNYELTFIFSM